MEPDKRLHQGLAWLRSLLRRADHASLPKAYPNGFDLTIRRAALDLPLRWQKPRTIFVNSMSDVFHADVPESYIAEVFDVMQRAQQHTFKC